MLEIYTLNYKLKKKMLRAETDFWRRAARTSRLLKVRKNVGNTNNFGKSG
jgi:hypothetical protein